MAKSKASVVVGKILRKAKHAGRRSLTVDESLEVIRQYGIPVVKGKIVKTAKAAADFAERVGYPVAMKIVSRDILHKTDVGGLALGLSSAADVRKAYKKMINSVRGAKPRAKIEGVLVQRMVEDGCEVIIGGKKDAQFGQTIAFGLGGLFVEVFEDVAFRVVPIGRSDAEDMVREIKGYKILSGTRGKKYDVRALVNLSLRVSKLLEENDGIKELDINPVFALGKGAIAVDARIILE